MVPTPEMECVSLKRDGGGASRLPCRAKTMRRCKLKREWLVTSTLNVLVMMPIFTMIKALKTEKMRAGTP